MAWASMSSSESISKPILSASPPSHRPRYFDIDHYLNRFIPRPRLYLLPSPISRLLGYRSSSQQQQPLGTFLTAFYAFLGAFCGISLTTYIFHLLPPLAPATPSSSAPSLSLSNPIIIASLGASAILEYNALSSPLAQPRALLLGQGLSATIGILVTKAFLLLPRERFEALRWLAGALAVALSSAVMTLTKSVHPPAGATALLAATTPEITALGWWLLALVELGSATMLAVALLCDNVHARRRFPIFWWTEHDLSHRRPSAGGEEEQMQRVETVMVDEVRTGANLEAALVVPPDFELSGEEFAVLEGLRERLEANEKASSMPPEVRGRSSEGHLGGPCMPADVHLSR